MPTIEEQHLVLTGGNGNVYYINIDEDTTTERHYHYFEIIVPTEEFITAIGNTLTLYFMKQDISTLDFTSTTELNSYSEWIDLGIDRSTYADKVQLISVNGKLIINVNNNVPLIDIKDKNFLVISVMINPVLNNPNKLRSDQNSNDYVSVIMFIDGEQITELIPIRNFYNGNGHIAQIATLSGYDYFIFNTEYERFMYKDLALMCDENSKKDIITINSNKYLKYPIFDTFMRKLLRLNERDGSNHIVLDNWSYGNYKYKYGTTFGSNSTSGIKMYKLYKIVSDDPTFEVKFNLIMDPDEHGNYFDFYCKNDYSFLSNVDTGYTTEMVYYTANCDAIDPDTNEYYFVVYIRSNGTTTYFGYCQGSSLEEIQTKEATERVMARSLTSSSWDIRIETDGVFTNPPEVGSLDIYDLSYSGNLVFPTNISEDEQESLTMSPNNYHWKSLWKYNRTIEYSAPLQDNPVILPLNVFTDDENENMFIEIVIDSNHAHSQASDTEDYCIALFDSLDFGSDINDRITNTGSEYVNANFNNGISVSYMRGTMLRVHKYSSGTKTRLNQYTSNAKKTAICFYYNSTDKKLMIHKKEENDYVNFDLEISGVDKSYLKNLYIHSTYLTEGDSVPITINFGPTSDYFQDYIDEILDQDNREDEVDISSDAEVDGVPSYTFETYPYSQATYNVVITIKPPFIAPEDAAKINESDYLTFSNSNLASYQYSYGVYNTDSMTLGYTLVFNRTYVPESTTEDVKKNNTDIIQISSSDGKYKYKITLKTIDVLKAGYFRFTSFDVPHTNLADLGEAAGQHSFNAIYNLYFESNISKYFITTDTSQWDEIISNTTIKAIGETSSSEATIIKNIEMKIEYVDTDRYINGKIEFKVNSQDMDFDQFNFRFTATYRLEELGIETTVTSPVITINGSGGTVTPEPGSYMFAAIPSGTLITERDYNTKLDEIKEETLRVYCNHEYSNNNSVIYISNHDSFDMRSPVNITSIQAARAKATATFTLPPDPNLETYMNTILEKYVEGFYTYSVTIDCGSQRVIDGGTRARIDEFKIQKINENQFELIMVCDYLGSNTYVTFQEDHSYQFDAYSTITYSYSDFGEDIYLALMKSTVTTKLEFTIIGTYYE